MSAATEISPITRGAFVARGRAAGLDLVQVSLIVMMFVAVWRVQDLYPVLATLKVQWLSPAFALLAFMFNHDPDRSLRSIRHPILNYLLGIAAIIVLGIPFSLWPGASANFFYNDHAKTLLLMVLIGASIRGIEDARRYALAHIAGALMYSYYVVNNFRMRNGRLGNLIYYDANDLGLLLVCTLPMCIYFLRPGEKAWLRGFSGVALLVILNTIVKTGSRGAFLGLIAVGIYIVLKFEGIAKSTRALAFGGGLAAMLVFGGETYWDMMSSLLQPTKDENWTGDVGRKAIWTRGFGYMITHPLLGVGAQAFPQAEGTISNIAARQQIGIGLKWSQAHNSFVQVGAELGVTGIVLFLAAIIASFKILTRAPPVIDPGFGHALAGTLVGYCVAGFFVSGGFSAYLYTVFGMILGLAGLASMHEEAAPRAVPVGRVRRVRGPLAAAGTAPRRAPSWTLPVSGGTGAGRRRPIVPPRGPLAPPILPPGREA